MVSENSFGKSFLTDSVRPLHRPFHTFSRGPFSLFLLYYLLRTIVTNDRERHKFLHTHPCSDTNGYIIARARNGKKRLIFDCSFFSKWNTITDSTDATNRRFVTCQISFLQFVYVLLIRCQLLLNNRSFFFFIYLFLHVLVTRYVYTTCIHIVTRRSNRGRSRTNTNTSSPD